MTTFKLTTANGVPMLVELRAETQQAAGWGRTPLPRPQVIFYDTRYNKPDGQRISTHYLDMLLQRPTYGLALDGGIPEWDINREDFAKVQTWLAEEAKKLP